MDRETLSRRDLILALHEVADKARAAYDPYGSKHENRKAEAKAEVCDELIAALKAQTR